MRTINDHVINEADGKITVTVMDEPGSGGANHHYAVDVDGSETAGFDVHFQNGPIGENGVNGIQQETLLAIVIDRLRSFQAGPFSSRNNAVALTKCEEALMWLHKRTLDRMRRGVEGKSVA